jgi:tRNA/tmRNA/rRNA uracil-C5-methylase (TrmA/RlmC/RlmD family)
MEDQPVSAAALNKGQQCTVTISDVAFGGEGVARLGEFVIFIPFVIPGEEVRVEITEVKKNFGRGVALEILKESPERVRPGCRYFGDCGGCQYQHISYAEQLRLKEKQIRDVFERVGHFADPPVTPIVPSPRQYGYRNRVMVRSQWDKFKQGLNIGFIRFDNRLVVDVEECPISEPEVNKQLERVRANPPPKGGLKVVLRRFPEHWEVPADSFFQNNFHLLPQLVERVREALRSSQSRFLVDVYCGVGFFGIALAAEVEAFAAVEYDKLAIFAARKNAARHQVTNGEFLIGDAHALLPQILERFPAAETTVLVDPPRAGCPPGSIELLRQVRPRQIIYVSCHPATLARDLNILCLDGVYKVVTITPLDMFPQTAHVECVADLRLADAS